VPKQQEVLDVISSYPEGVDIKTIADHFNMKPFGVSKVLSDLKKKDVVIYDNGLYRRKGTIETTAESAAKKSPSLPGDFDEFLRIGQSVGVSGDFLKAVADFIFAGHPYDVAWVHQALNSLHLRIDTVARWTNMWAATIGQPALRQAVEATTPLTTTSPAQKKYIILGGRPVPDENGPYTFHEALQVIESETRGQPSGGNDIKELRGALESLRQEMQNQQIKALQSQLEQQAQQNERRIDEVLTRIDRDRSVKSEYDILSQIAAGAMDEAKAWRGMVKEAVVPPRLPPPKTPEEREQRKQKYRANLQKDQRIEELGKRLFYGEKTQTEAESKSESRPGCFLANGAGGCANAQDTCGECQWRGQTHLPTQQGERGKDKWWQA